MKINVTKTYNDKGILWDEIIDGVFEMFVPNKEVPKYLYNLVNSNYLSSDPQKLVIGFADTETMNVEIINGYRE